MQRFKSVYFSDYPAESAKQRNLKLAFGPDDTELFATTKRLSSEYIRRLLGYHRFSNLKEAAKIEGVSVNAFCLGRLRRYQQSNNEQFSLFPQIDPISATFRGGAAEPLHDWYPYLEGYSPEFVRDVLRTFAPSATRILDPFAGTGTTLLTSAREDRQSFYCELNPLLQFLVDTKAKLLAMSEQDRLGLATRLGHLANDGLCSLVTHEPDRHLAEAYSNTFGNSEFFLQSTMDAILRLRSWIDVVNCTDPEAASIVTIAVVSALVPCSKLIRRGDLRFRKGAECNNIVADMPGMVRDKLLSMANDITCLSKINHPPLFVAGDAKRLGRLPSLRVNAIVTSPPYLNGTNYYRNTKIELWFLRALLSGHDLSAFRRQTVTAGINDVTSQKNPAAASGDVEAIVQLLRNRAYDARIPKMVLSYFADMKEVFSGLLHHATPASRLLIDIGDSAYAGIRVDTPKILAQLLQSDGWRIDHEITLRQRLSRSRQPLKQVLLVATAPSRKSKRSDTEPSWRLLWTKFKKDLPHQQDEFAKRNWGNSLHSLCSYQGKMKPSLAHHLVKTFTKPGDHLLDPFGGVGTIPFEAAMNGVQTWSFDISPVAVQIASAKLGLSTKAACDAQVKILNCFIHERRPTLREQQDAELISFNGPLPAYFHEKTFTEILLARRFFQDNPPGTATEALVFSCLLHILHGNRPYALSRNSHPITPFSPTGKAEYKSVIGKLREKLERSLEARRPDGFVPGRSIFQDATTLWPQDVDSLDAIITSPPFFNSTRFYLANWMRLWFSGWGIEDFKKRPLSFVDERQKSNFRVYENVLRQARERLKAGGVCVFHLGKSRKCNMSEEISRLAKPWFSHAEVFGECVKHCESHGIRDKGTVVEHSYLVLH